MLNMERVQALLVTLFFITFDNETLGKKRVCVIGAGRIGLAAIKVVADQIDEFEPIAFERNSDVGGLWIYREDPELDEHGLPAHSGIYKNLRTITYKDVMIYPDYPNITSTDGYPTHEKFLEYMRNYTNHFQLRRYIQLDTLVTKVTPLKGTCTRGTTRWRLEKRNLNTRKDETTTCDALILCNGRFSKANIPKIAGMDSFRGKVLHSRSYRKPEDFINKTVILLGAQASGTGISRDLSPYAKTVYLSRRKTHGVGTAIFPANVIIVNAVVKVDSNQFTLEDGSKISADSFIFCTGYVYDFPFLDESSGITFDKYQLLQLKNKFINKKYPSMALMGFGLDNAFAQMYYSEAEDFLKSLQGNK